MALPGFLHNKWVLYGGIGAVALVGGYMLVKGNSGSSAASGSSDLSSYPPTVYGSAPVASTPDTTSSTGDGTASSTDASIQALIASTLTQAQNQLTATLDTNATQKAIALGSYASNENIATTNANAAIEQSLAGQLGGLAGLLQTKTGAKSSSSSGFLGFGGGSSSTGAGAVGLPGISGTLGYNNGVIAVNLAPKAA